MAGAVRELITSVKITLDNQSLNQTNKAINKLKQKVKNLSDQAYKIKVGLNTTSVNQISTKIKDKLANAQIKVSLNTASLNQAVAKIKNKLANTQIKVTLNAASLNQAVAKINNKLANTQIKVTLNTASLNQISSKINNKLANIQIKVTLNAASLNQAVAKINNKLANTQIKVGVNTNSVNQALSRIRSQLSNANLRLNASITGMTIRASVVNLHGRINALGNRGGSVRNSGGGGGVRNGGSVGDLGGSALGLAAAYGGYVSTGDVINTADAMMNLDGRLRTVTKTEEERLDVESQLYAMGQKTRQPLESLSSLYFAVARASEEMGFAQKENMRVTETVSKALIIGGASAQEASATITQLGQALGSGRLQGDELRSLDENASALMRHVAKYFKTNVAGLKQMGAEGKLTSDEVMRAILSAGKAIDEEFTKMPMTFSQSMNVMGNSWNRFILKFEQKTSVFSSVARGMTKAFDEVGSMFDDFNLLMGTPDPKKMVTITEAATGETKQISEADYYRQKAAQNPGMMETVKALKELGKWLDELDGKAGNIDEQIAGWVKTLLKVGAVLAPILVVLTAISGLITILTPIIGMFEAFGGAMNAALAPVGKAIMGALEPILGTGLAPVLAILVAIASVIYFIYENWDLVVEWFKPGLDSIMEGLDELKEAWEKIQPLIDALIPLLKIVATVIGGAIVGALSIMFRLFAWVFNEIAKLINWVAGLLGGLGETIQWLGNGLAGLIEQALEFIGMAPKIEGVNRAVVQRIWDRGTGQNSVSQTQNNTYNLPAMQALPAAQKESNSFFKSRINDYE